MNYLYETQDALERFLCGRSLKDGCIALGYPPRKVAMLRDVLHVRHGHVSAANLDDLRTRLNLPPVPVTVPACPCPTCNVVHGDGYDCHGAHGDIAIIPEGARIVPPSKRRRLPYKRPTWAMVRALEARIAELESRL